MSRKSTAYQVLTFLLVAVFLLSACQQAAPTAPAGSEGTTGETTTGETATEEGQVAVTGDQISILVWDQFTEGGSNEVFNQIIENFTKEHPNIEVRRESMTRDQQLQTAKTALASGTGPDLIYMDSGPGNAGLLIDAGLLAPLEPYAPQYNWKDRFFPWAQQFGSREGQLYGLSMEMEFVGVYVNRGLMDEAGLTMPTTDAEVLDFCAQAKEMGYIPFAWSNNPGWQSFHQFGMLANNTFGSEGMENLLFQNQGTWTDPRLVEAVQFFFTDMQEAGCFIDDVNSLEYNDANSLFYTGKALLNPTGTWLIAEINENMPDAQIEMVPFPSINGGERVLPGGLGSAWFISANSQNPDEVAMFLDYMFNEASQKLWIEQAGFLVPLAFDPSGWNISPLMAFAIDTAQAGGAGEAGSALGFYIDTAAPASFNQMMQDGFQGVAAGIKTPEQQLQDLQKEWDTMASSE
jgi:raffinose/stachyose/melibiose transport system substrate-binding protein